VRSPCCEGALRRPSVGHHEHLRSGEEEKGLTLEIVRSLSSPELWLLFRRINHKRRSCNQRHLNRRGAKIAEIR